MGKVTCVAAALMLTIAAFLVPAAAFLVPAPILTTHAQALPPVSCSAPVATTPMQGHYTGPWQSDGIYHFYVFGKDLELEISISGSIDAYVTSDGHVTGYAHGTVNAPVTHDGAQDVSSGYGTISGSLGGVLGSSGTPVVLSHPVIDMHWGTFVGGGYTVERFIQMPDYQLPIAANDCISAQGIVSESGFPVQNIVADGAGMTTQAPGIGLATGTWRLTSDKAQVFSQLSAQVDSFISQANAFLADPAQASSYGAVLAHVAQPLAALEAQIRQDPDVARCLLDRLGVWQATVVQPSLNRALGALANPGPVALRQASDALRSARALNQDCGISDATASAAVQNAARSLVDRTLASRLWPDAALAIREDILLGGDAERLPLQQAANRDIHVLLGSSSATGALLEVARLAYTLGDDTDSMAAWKSLTTTSTAAHLKAVHKCVKKKGKKCPPKTTVKPTPTPTATTTPKTLQQIISGGIVAITARSGGGSSPTLSWSAVPVAASYVVVVTGGSQPALTWAWSGTATTVTYGDTTIDGLAGSRNDAWPATLDLSGGTWTVLALNSKGQIVGAMYRGKLVS